MIPDLRKPKDREGKITLSPSQRRAKRDTLYVSQGERCASCGCQMTLKPYHFNSAELDHIKPQPAGCAKRDNEDNLQVLCNQCNSKKGSKRL